MTYVLPLHLATANWTVWLNIPTRGGGGGSTDSHQNKQTSLLACLMVQTRGARTGAGTPNLNTERKRHTEEKAQGEGGGGLAPYIPP